MDHCKPHKYELQTLKNGKVENLRPRKGAIAEILTRFIKPRQPNPPGGEHRSMAVLEEEDKDDNHNNVDEDKLPQYAEPRDEEDKDDY
ncbi:unnamed protein product [Cylindrotheca closterium]|uniref:Uncharacterized protein n=1 Tax=Cylindrotheca closterium TaxID=2856 RepID=A0AAD2G7L5_9STRA|nr:unnamed protein product [Cylindrotheca closterium]